VWLPLHIDRLRRLINLIIHAFPDLHVEGELILVTRDALVFIWREVGLSICGFTVRVFGSVGLVDNSLLV
jgi:hypothetical protein